MRARRSRARPSSRTRAWTSASATRSTTPWRGSTRLRQRRSAGRRRRTRPSLRPRTCCACRTASSRRAMSARVQPLLDVGSPVGTLANVDCAMFYSITNCQEGLRGISFGNLLIKQVAEDLKRELPHLRRFATLSPIPGFRGWLDENRMRVAVGAEGKERLALLSRLEDPAWHLGEVPEALQSLLMRLCAYYLLNAKQGLEPLDAVARFHLGNGANHEVIRRDDWYWTMSAVLLSRQEQRPIFDQAFQIFWRDPKLTEAMMQMLLPQAYGRAARPEQQQSQRLTDALFSQQREAREKDAERLDIEARLTFSSREVLQRMDFDTMSAAELAEAKKMIARLRLPLPMIRTRRFRPERAGRRIDLRATLRESLREGGDIIALVRAAPGELHPPLVVLCDISGSMNPYSRMFLHFLHAITNDRDRVSVFVFGTRLTNITRQLRHRDVDVAMAKVADAIKDWSGGTRIGASLREFNFKWARRTLGQNACVLLVSDGLDREAGEGLGEEMERLAKSSRYLVWLNPLLRYDKFEARPAGVRAILPHVDLFLPVHNLKSLVDLAKTLNGPMTRQNQEKRAWK